MTPLQGKHMLITAGPTWIPIDKVRVITNIFGGALGVKVTEAALKEGAQVTLLFGPGNATLPPAHERLEVVRYKYYEQLLELMKEKVGSKQFDVVIHSAAVADYMPTETFDGKIKSGQEDFTIHMKPTIKIVDLIKSLDPHVFLVKFKLEVGISDQELIDIAYKSLEQSKADLIVANEFSTVMGDHKAFIISKKHDVLEVCGKEVIAETLMGQIIVHLNTQV